jgi:hypothetical protein
VPATTLDPLDAPRKRWSVGRILTVATVLVLVLFWIWVFTGLPKKANPDHISDKAWVERAEATCKATLDRIEVLPGAEASPTAADRADVLDLANDDLAQMLDRLAGPGPTDPGDATVVDQWLADWRIYLGDRRDFANRLRRDRNAKLLLDEKHGHGIDEVITIFAHDANDMPSCAAPGDVA